MKNLEDKANFAFENIFKCIDETKRGAYIMGFCDGWRNKANEPLGKEISDIISKRDKISPDTKGDG